MSRAPTAKHEAMSSEIDNTIRELAERVRELETLQRINAEQAKEDRADMKTEISGIKADLSSLNKTFEALVNQVKGGSIAIKSMWAVGGFVLSAVAWFSGILHKLFPFLPR